MDPFANALTPNTNMVTPEKDYSKLPGKFNETVANTGRSAEAQAQYDKTLALMQQTGGQGNIVANPTIAVDKLQAVVPPPTLPSAPTTTKTGTTPVNPPPVIPEVAPAPKAETTKSLMEKFLTGQMSGGGAIDTAKIREEANVAAKQKAATNLYNEILQKDQAHKDRIIALEKNPEGKSTSHLNAELNKLNTDYSRQRANDLISYNILNSDFQAAEKVVQDRIADLKDQRNYELSIFKTAFDFVQNDMTESEKLQVQQAFQEKQDKEDFERQKELAKYENDLKNAGGSGLPEIDRVIDINGVQTPVDKYGNVINIAGATQGSQEQAQKTTSQLDFLKTTADSAIELAGSGGIIKTPLGPGVITKAIGAVVKGGNTSYNRLQNLTDTLKTNLLTLQTDPAIKKFFGPQMSNADVRLMMSGGTTLNPEVQNADEYIAEATRISNLLERAKYAVQSGGGSKYSVQDPQGNVHYFPDQASLDSFKKAAKLQ